MLVGAFNKEKALVGAFSVIVKSLRGLVSSSNRYLAIIYPLQDDVRRPRGVGAWPGPHHAPADGPAGVRAGAGSHPVSQAVVTRVTLILL